MKKELPLEEALERLDQIVKAMEEGGLKLEESIRLFEEGIELVKLCNQRLNAAELKVNQLYAPLETETEDEDESD
jgi:exodeoxyribonuclease VII small subunit